MASKLINDSEQWRHEMVIEAPEELLKLTDRLFRERATWPELIKQIRVASGADILTAETIALSHDGWRRFCAHRINNDPKCRKLAARHLKLHGKSSLIASDVDGFKVRNRTK